MLGDASSQQQAKLVLLGDMGAGKSSLVLRFVKGQFYDYQVRVQRLPPLPFVPPVNSTTVPATLEASVANDGLFNLCLSSFIGVQTAAYRTNVKTTDPKSVNEFASAGMA